MPRHCLSRLKQRSSVLHVDSDFATVADVLAEVRQRDIRT
jgi:hypothetical protein